MRFWASTEQRHFTECISRLVHCNPFLEERIALEREALGPQFVPGVRVWSAPGAGQAPSVNATRLAGLGWEQAEALRTRLEKGARPSAAEARRYEELVFYALYSRYDVRMAEVLLRAQEPGASRPRLPFYDEFEADWQRFFGAVGLTPAWTAPHVFSIGFQLRSAFDGIYRNIIGGSLETARLRAAVWQSIFTHDMGRYVRSVYSRMQDVTTLILGPSGTGKELVARAIGQARYLPFDPKSRTLAEGLDGLFRPLNLSALAPTLVESELFGHRKGAFTGALADRTGWLEACGPLGTVFLDEIGELEAGLQVKLLRVLQSRRFERLGETDSRAFHGKVVAATNRDLGAEIEAGRFRLDFYYRLCSDIVRVPSLADRLRSEPSELATLVLALSLRLVGEEEAPQLAAEVEGWVAGHLGADYPWPGNVRELEQCVRNVLVRGRYEPLTRPPVAPGSALPAGVLDGNLSADELLDWYCALVHGQAGSYQEASRRLGLDRRTVRRRALRGSEAGP